MAISLKSWKLRIWLVTVAITLDLRLLTFEQLVQSSMYWPYSPVNHVNRRHARSVEPSFPINLLQNIFLHVESERSYKHTSF